MINFDEEYDEEYEEDYQKVEQLVGILKMMERPEALLQDLLDAICEEFELFNDGEIWETYEIFEVAEQEMWPSIVFLSCPRHQRHVMRPKGFQLLELAEGMMGTCLQEITGFGSQGEHFDDQSTQRLDQVLLARLSRQTQEIGIVNLHTFAPSPRKGLFAALLQRAESLDLQLIDLRAFDEENWSWFAKIVQHHTKEEEIFRYVTVDKETLGKANIEHLKTVWEAIYEDTGLFEITEGEDVRVLEESKKICEDVM